jgi:hypothetical protein
VHMCVYHCVHCACTCTASRMYTQLSLRVCKLGVQPALLGKVSVAGVQVRTDSLYAPATLPLTARTRRVDCRNALVARAGRPSSALMSSLLPVIVS